MTTPSPACDPSLVELLACPVDGRRVFLEGESLTCSDAHRYPIVDGVPVMLPGGRTQTMAGTEHSLRRAHGESIDQRRPELYLESLGISDDEKRGVVELAGRGGPIDPVVAYLVAATNGLMYRHLIGTLDRYPIPAIPLPAGDGRLLLDVGCSWGRWSLAAHQQGYRVIGLDPSLGAVMAARRVARQLGAPNRYVVGDARWLPFIPEAFDVVFSYSVVQHFSRPDAAAAVGEMGRVLKPGGLAKVQMATRYGLRCLYHQARRGFGDGHGFEVRYWSLPELSRLFRSTVGEPRREIDGFFGIGLQPSDESLMTPRLRRALRASEWLKSASRSFPALVWVADSVFTSARKADASPSARSL